MRTLFSCLLFVAMLSTAVGAQTPDPNAATFAYTTVSSLATVRTRTAWTQGGATIHEVVLPGPATRLAYLVTPGAPPGPRGYGAALMVHWLGNEETTNRREFLADAIELAGHGVVSLLPDAMWSAHDWYDSGRTYASDYSASIEQVRELRSALDVLLLQPAVDAQRLALVGHDFGAMYGALLVAVDKRIQYGVFMAGTPSFNDWYLYNDPPADLAAYKARMDTIEPAAFLRRAQLRDALFQYARHDFYVPPKKFAEFYVADHGPKVLHIYGNAGHDLMVPAATEDRRAWLEARISTGS